MATRRNDIREALQQRLSSGLHLGVLQPGERLASARETARDLGTDYRVVVAAVRDLERDGLLEIRPRAGIFVGRPVTQRGDAALAGFGNRLVDLLLDEVAKGLPIARVVESVRRSLETVRLRAACIECNQDQLDFLCYHLQTDYSVDSAAIAIDHLRGEPPLALRQADLVVSTTFHAGEVRHLAARLGKPSIIVTLDPRRRAEVARLLAERPVYFIGTDPRWAAKVRAIWAGEARAENLHPVTLGYDSLADIPEEAAVMVMPAARRQLAGSPLLARALSPRGFSRETARQIITFIVRANVMASLAQAKRVGC